MKRAYSMKEIKEAELRAIRGGTDAETLMERAGESLAEAVRRAMEARGVHDCLFVIGGGNNGGDGWVAARILHEKGYDVRVLTLAECSSPTARRMREKFRGEVLHRITKQRYAIIVDCLLGTGISRSTEGDTKRLIEMINESGAYVVSCDLPSGLGEGGIAMGAAVRADATVTMGGLKSALILSDGADLAGELEVADIGLSPEGGISVYEEADYLPLFPKRKSHSNKGTYGTVSVVAGFAAQGAPLLAAGGALRSGAGCTKLWIPSVLFPSTHSRFAVAARLPACILKEYQSAEELLQSDAIAFGMGAGCEENAHEILKQLLSAYRGKLVLDADALNLLALHREQALLKKAQCQITLTPHPKEFSRLTGSETEAILRDPVEAASAFSKRYGVCVVLKNNRTVIAKGERRAVVTCGSPALAKGGSGDVLAGLIAGSMARGLSPFEGSLAGCYLLGKAGECAEREKGEYAPDATDIIAMVGRRA